MPSAKITAFTDYAGGQSPVDLVYIAKSPFGGTDDRKSTLNDFLSTITKNISDGVVRYQGFAAPAVSAVNQGAFYYDGVSQTFKASRNASAYHDVLTGTGSNLQVAVWSALADRLLGNAIFTFDAVTGFVNLGPFGVAAGNTTELRFQELAANGTNYFAIKAADSITNSRTMLPPVNDPTPGQALIVSAFSAPTITTAWGTVSATPAGPDKAVQYNDGGVFGGDANLTWDKVLQELVVTIPSNSDGFFVGRNGKTNPSFVVDNGINADNGVRVVGQTGGIVPPIIEAVSSAAVDSITLRAKGSGSKVFLGNFDSACVQNSSPGFFLAYDQGAYAFGNSGSAAVSTPISMIKGTTVPGIVGFASGATGATGGSYSSLPITPAVINANTNDYNPGGRALYALLESSADVDLTGFGYSIVPASAPGETHMIINIGATFNITLKDQNASSQATNRFLNSTGADIVLAPKQAALLWHDNDVDRWRVFKMN